MPGIQIEEDASPGEYLEKIKLVRQSQKTGDLCFGRTKNLYSFKKEVFSYHFKDAPDYDKLRQILRYLRIKENDIN